MPNTVALNTNTTPAANSGKRPGFFKRRREYNIFGLLTLILGSVFMLYPFVYALSGSLASTEAGVYTTKLFQEWEFSNYVRVFEEADLHIYIWNTLLIVIINCIGTVISNCFIGFGFARYNFKGSQTMFFLVLCTMFLPSTVMQIPLFVIWSELHCIDTYIPLCLTHFFGGAMNIFLMRQCFLGLPSGLYEAAMIDGAHPLYIWARIYMPLARPMIATMVLRVFTSTWNDLFSPLIYLTSNEKRTISLALANFNSKYGEGGGGAQLCMAAAVVAMLPSIVIYAFTQKQFIAGLASAAIKG